jgi:putative ABC transport system permease protein
MDEAVGDLIAGGATPEEARRTVRLSYGDDLPAREDVRDYGWEAWLGTLASDLRLSARSLRRSPGFTTVVVLTLGVGVGAATAIFSAVRPVLFEPLAYPQPERILSVAHRSEDGSTIPSAFRAYVEILHRNAVFESLAVFKPWQPTLTGAAEPERLEGQSVSAGYFDVLGMGPGLGPGFDASADRPGGPRLVILSDGLWRRRFDADPAAVGRVIQLDGDAHTIVGVMPATFENVTAPLAQAWTLLQYDQLVTGFDTREWGHHLEMMGRARAGVGPSEAREALDAIARQPVPEFARPTWGSWTRGFLVRPLRDATTADARPTMLVFTGAVALLLAATCANLTLVLLARGARRRSEFAMRAALGAGRGRLARYLLTESLVLAGLGGAVGIALARVGLSTLVALSPSSLPRLHAIQLDGVALAFALGVTTLVGGVFGLAPGLHRSVGQPQAIREAGRGSARRSRATRRALVVTELALATVLLVGAGLILRSTERLFSLPLGFDPSQLAVVQIHGTGLEPGDAVTHRFFDEALDAVRLVPGVVSAVETSQLPLSGDRDVYGVVLDDGAGVEGADGAAYRYTVSPGYLGTMGTRLLRGRDLSRDDVELAPPVAVVSEGLAGRLFQDRDPIGARIQVGPVRPEGYTIVGVAEDVKQASLEAEETEAVYVPSHQWHWADRVRWMVVRAEGDPLALVPSIQRAIWTVDADQPVVRAQSMATVVAHSEARRRFVLVVMSAFGLTAMTLAVIGLYGVVAGMVVERLPEMGVRAALGASYESIVALVARQGMALTAAGVFLGMVVSVAASGLLATFLFGVSRVDPLTYLIVIAVLAAGSAFACAVPAMRAGRVDPVETLRGDSRW